ncbi:MAG: curli production assembly/transport component CsgG, partial [Rhodobacteraceae bacterium]|nr:curli production assembly/transport component CsgG [Paracoccaceae bacterium]
MIIRKQNWQRLTFAFATLAIAGCSPALDVNRTTKPLLGPPVTDNSTPYSVCLDHLAQKPGRNRPTLTIGDIRDKTGKYAYDQVGDSTELTQGASEMVISAFYKTRQVNLAERLDPRIALAEQQLVAQDLIAAPLGPPNVAPAHFLVLGALTELNYHIQSGGERLFVSGIGGSRRA